MPRLRGKGQEDALEPGGVEGVVALVVGFDLGGVGGPLGMRAIVEDAPDAFHESYVHVDEVIVATGVVEGAVLGSDGIVTLLVVAEVAACCSE